MPAKQAKQPAMKPSTQPKKRRTRAQRRRAKIVAAARVPTFAKVKEKLRMAADTETVEGMNLCMQMALPKDTSPQVLLPTTDGPKVAHNAFRYSDVWNASTKFYRGPFGLAENMYIALVYGQVGLSYIDGPWAPDSGTNYYDARFNNDDALTFRPTSRTQSANEEVGFDLSFPIGGLSSGTISSSTPGYKGGVREPVGRDKTGTPYIFLNPGEYVTATSPAGSSYSSGCRLILKTYRYYGTNLPKEFVIDYVATATPGGATIFTAIDAGFYTFEYSAWRAGTATEAPPEISLQVRSNASLDGSGRYMFPIFRIHTLSDVWANGLTSGDPNLGKNCRRTGMSLLVTNTSAPLYKQGRAIGARLLPDTPNNLTFDDAIKVNERYTNEAAKGLYTYVAFTQDDERFRDCVDGVYDTILSYYLDDIDFVHFIAFDGLGTTNTLALTLDSSIEFRTDSQRYPMKTAVHSPVTLTYARRINAMTPWFFENPLHPRDIMRWISSGWEATRRNANAIARGVSVAFPEYAPVAMPLGRLLQA